MKNIIDEIEEDGNEEPSKSLNNDIAVDNDYLDELIGESRG